MNLMDLSKFKRFFAFGCSMTSYRWPTWADIIAQEIPESYNYGKSGGGNLFIACTVAEINQRFKFDKDDLVMIMWSSICREDRYFNNWWHTPGNIFTQDLYDAEWVEKFADPKGYLIRDMAMIDLTKNLLENTNSEWHFLNMAPFELLICAENKNMGNYREIMHLYKDTLKYVKKDILNQTYQGIWPKHPISAPGGQTSDYHPSPKGHYHYLKSLYPRLNLKKTTLEFIDQYEEIVSKAREISDIDGKWIKKDHYKF